MYSQKMNLYKEKDFYIKFCQQFLLKSLYVQLFTFFNDLEQISKLMRLLILQIILTISFASLSSVQMEFANGTNQFVYSDGSLSQLFQTTKGPLNCVQDQIYILKQNSSQLASNAPYTIFINTTSSVNVYIWTKYNHFIPTYSPSYCSSSCTITILNNCPLNINSDNYFDFLNLQITGMPTATYRVWCNSSYKPATFQWGLFILILAVTVIISLSAYYSRAWSIGGQGVRINYWIVIALNILWIIGALLGAFLPQIAYIIVIILSWAFGVVCVGFCCNQTLWLLKSEKINTPFLWLIRPIDVISFLVGLGVVFSWWFTEMNWISSDIIGVCTIIAFIKCFKFTSMQMATLMLSTILALEVIIALIIYFVLHQSYNNLLLNQFNNPMFLQIPTINQELDQRCAWIPVTEVIFPGIFLSYLRRFDDSRNTRVYMIVGCISFYVGSMAWMTMTTFNIHAWPFALFSQTLLFALVAIFATKRNEIRTIWNGKFYDAQFADIYESDQLKKTFSAGDDRVDQKEIEMRESILQGLRASSKPTISVNSQAQSQFANQNHVI